MAVNELIVEASFTSNILNEEERLPGVPTDEQVEAAAGNWLSKNVVPEIAGEADAWLEENITQETGYVLDRSLTLQNAAAPADMVGEIKKNVSQDYKVAWMQGWYGASSGVIDVSQPTAICTQRPVSPFVSKVVCESGFKMRLQAFQKGSYKGIWNGSTWKTTNPNYYLTDIDFTVFFTNYPDYLFVLCLYKTDGSAVVPSDGVNVTFTIDKNKYISDTAPQRYYNAYGGASISPRRNVVTRASYNQSLPGKPSGTGSQQGNDMYNGIIFRLASNDMIQLIDLATVTKIAEYSISCDHGNSCQFGKEIASGDDYPHLFCFGYETKFVYENQVTNSGATLVKKYYLPITGYRISGGYDADRNLFMTIHYAKNASNDPIDNYCVLCTWDLSSLTDNGDGTYTPLLRSETNVPFVGVIQDCKVFGGWLYVLSGMGGSSPYKNAVLSAYNDTTLINSVKIFDPGNNEPEGLFFAESGSDVVAYVATLRLYVVSFD